MRWRNPDPAIPLPTSADHFPRQSMATQFPRRNPVLIGLAVLVLAAVLWFAVGPLKRMVAPRRAAAPAPAVSVTSAQVKRENVPIGLAGVGTVQAMATGAVKPHVD